MTSKKKILTTLSVVLILGLAVLGVLAYLTDTDSDVNVMTTGEVSITQNEQQRVEKNGEFSSELEPFEQGKTLMPYTSRTGTKDIYTVGTHQVKKSDNVNNYIDKIVSVTNTGKSDAYVRTLLAIPTGGSDWEPTPVAAADTWLHWNTTTDMNQHWYSMWSTQEGHTYAGVLAEIDGKGYYVFEFTHKTAIEPDYTTFPTLLGCYMDNRVNHDDNGYFMDMNSNGKYDGGDKRIEDVTVGDTVEILVLSQAVQADGFADSQTALDTAFGDVNAENAANWFDELKTPVKVSTVDELKEALDAAEAGDQIYLDADLKDIGTVTVKSGVTLNGNGNTISGNSCVYMSAKGDVTIENVKFENINNGITTGKGGLSAIYCVAEDSGAKVVKNCTFNGVAHDAIQITTNRSYENFKIDVTITDNVFKGDSFRYIHVEPTIRTGVTADLTITGNKMYTTENTAANIGIFCVNYEGSTFNISNNYAKLNKFYAYNGDTYTTTDETAWKMFADFATDRSLTETYVPYVLASTDNGQILEFYETKEDAEKAIANRTLTLVTLNQE